MTLDALTRRSDGSEVSPAEDSALWVSASTTRNHVLGDPLLDWLNEYGKARGFTRDDEVLGYDDRTAFTPFIFDQGRRFEVGVIGVLREHHPELDLVAISSGHEQIRDHACAVMTFEAMREGVPLIHQAVLWDAEHRTYGAPDLLVRSDVLARLFPDSVPPEVARIPAPDLGTPWHYVVLDIKFSTLRLNVAGIPGNSGSAPAYKSQLHIYNRALGRLQGYEPADAFLLGRGWEQTIEGTKQRGTSCLERIASVPQTGTLANKVPIALAVADATTWLRRVRTEGASWDVLPAPTVRQLYPNMGYTQDGPWHGAKRELAEQLGELTLLWYVGEGGRKRGHDAGVYHWRDPRCTPAVLGVTGEKRPGTLDALMTINRSEDRPPVSPAHIRTARSEWLPTPPLEFFVDFETVSDLADDFTALPEKGGQALIFMVGCGHIEDGEWRFASFTVDALSEHEEARILDEWFAHMAAVRARLAPDSTEEPKLIHWSHAEVSTLETAYNSARNRQPQREWPALHWYDFLSNVMREEPVVVRGAMGFGLKDIAKAMHRHGLVETVWSDGPTDGLGAMVGAWWAQRNAIELGIPLSEDALVLDIAKYNEVDCKVMWEVIDHLRREH
ncbi:MAG: hypothetical protein O3A10_13530 [Chloroflexi bacterium]|nr:hypothetical protein [Chloroflexota bacterium]MDA1148014.1 hypothetical protein [Chloroflexota bacterium]